MAIKATKRLHHEAVQKAGNEIAMELVKHLVLLAKELRKGAEDAEDYLLEIWDFLVNTRFSAFL